MKRPVLVRTLRVTAVMMLIAACESADDSKAPDGGSVAVDASGPDTVAGELRVGPEGGTLRERGAEITIPEGAVDEEVTIRIRVVPQPEPLTAGWEASGEFYEITPHGLSFAVPITVVLPYDGPVDDSLSLGRLEDGEDTWQEVDALSFDSGSVRFELDSLSYYVAVRRCPEFVEALEPDEVIVGCGHRECGVHPAFAVCGTCGSCGAGATCDDGTCVATGDAGTGPIDAGMDSGTAPMDAGADSGGGMTDGSTGDVDAGTDAGSGGQDAGVDAGGADAGVDAGGVDAGVDAGGGITSGAVGITSGYNHVCTVNDDGTLWCWGSNSSGQYGDGTNLSSTSPIRTDTATDWASIVPGSSYTSSTCALKADGAMWCAGSNSGGQFGTGDATASNVFVPAGGGYLWESASVGTFHSCGVQLDHTLWCWGQNSRGQLGTSGGRNPTQVGTDTDWAQVSAGRDSTCAVKTDGRLYCWGSNLVGQLGLGDTRPSPSSNFPDETSPQQVGTDTDWSHVTSGYITTCATKTNGTLWCWGRGNAGQLGDGVLHTGADVWTPLQAIGTNWVETQIGDVHVCGLKSTGELLCWGDSPRGQTGGNARGNAPRPVTAATNWVGLAVMGTATCGLHDDMTVECWGDNGEGVRGDPAVADKKRPALSDNGGGWSAISAGDDHACALKTDDTLWCWGANYARQVGNGANLDDAVPSPVQIGAATWQSVSAGGDHTCGIQSDGTPWCWGLNNSGQVGNNVTGGDVNVPVQIDTDTTWSVLASGSLFTCGIKDGGLWCWGTQSSGRLGNGLNSSSPIPVPTQTAGTDTDWADVCTGTSHTCALKTGGTLHCWGSDGYGQVGNGDAITGNQVTPIQIGTDTDWTSLRCAQNTSCAQKSDGSVWCWGGNYYGITGDGTSASAATAPVQITSPTAFTIYDAAQHVCGLAADGVYCWGYNGYNQIGDGTQDPVRMPAQISADTDWSALAAGFGFTCGLRTSGDMWCWGDYRSGQLARGSWWSDVPFQVSFTL